MALIKTALELALERTRDVAGDPSLLAAHEARQRGKKLAGVFLDGVDSIDEESHPSDPAARLEAFAREFSTLGGGDSASAALREGALDVLVSQIKLPELPADLDRLALVGQGLSVLLASKRYDELFGQLKAALGRYLDEVSQYEELIRQQYAPKLRQKEEELARRTGRAISLDPMQDPEFVQFRSQNMQALRERYEAAVEQLREEARTANGPT